MSKPWISDSSSFEVVLGQGRGDQRGAGDALALQDLLGQLLLVDGPVDRLPHQRVEQGRVSRWSFLGASNSSIAFGVGS